MAECGDKGAPAEGLVALQLEEGLMRCPAVADNAEGGDGASAERDGRRCERNTLPEGVSLAGREGDGGERAVTGKGDRGNCEQVGTGALRFPSELASPEEAGKSETERRSEHAAVVCRGADSGEGLDKLPQEREGDGELGGREGSANDPLEATNGTLQAFRGEGSSGEAEIDVPGLEH